MEPSPFAFAPLGLGFVLGLRHALEADHLVAVTTIAGRSRSAWRSSLVGAAWGLGHSAALLLASVAVLAVGRTIPERVARGFEAAVGLMIIALGLDLLRRLRKGEMKIHSHVHDGHEHLHAHVKGVVESEKHHPGWRPFLVGIVHGLAGSAALTLFVLSTVRSFGAGLAYVAIFGLGTIVGMAAMSTLVGLPFVVASRKAGRLGSGVQVTAALGSIAFGCWYVVSVLQC